MALAVINVIYNNLLTNLRFKCKTVCKSCGICVYDLLNWFFGFCCLKKVCQDRCFTWGTLVKWCVHIAIFGTTIWSVNLVQKDMP